MHEFQEAWFSLKISRHLVFTLLQKSSCAWNTDTIMSRKWNWIIKKIILCICVAGLSSKTSNGHENCNLIFMIFSNFLQNVNFCYCCYQQRQQSLLAIMISKRSKWSNSFGELYIIIHWQISVNHCWKFFFLFYMLFLALNKDGNKMLYCATYMYLHSSHGSDTECERAVFIFRDLVTEEGLVIFLG